MVSARNILGETYQPKIKEYLLEGKQIKGNAEFDSLDDEVLETLISRGSKSIAVGERKKITKMMKAGHSAEEVLQQVDTRFLSVDKASEQIANHQQVKHHNSAGGRMLNIGGGVGLIILTVVIMFASGRLFYFLPILGIIMIVKGFLTETMSYDS